MAYVKEDYKDLLFCINCGHKVSFDAKFCPRCGVNLKEHRAWNSVTEFIRKLEETCDLDEKEKVIRAFTVPD